jgi:uncharacterized protein (TIGR02246 family)
MQTTQADASANPSEDERAIISIEHKLGQAYLSGDAEYLDSIMSPDFILTNVRGEVSKKAEEVAEVRNGIIHYEKFETSDLNVRVYGDAAVVTGRTSIKGTVKKSGRIIDAQIRLTDTFVRQMNGKWRIAAGQTTLIPSQQPTSNQRPSPEKSEAGKVYESRVETVSAADGRRDFDFLVGQWRVHHRRLNADSHEWMDFEGTSSNRKLMDGGANMEEHALNATNGAYRAVALRSYDSKTGQWAIWWLDGRYPSGPLDPPVVGHFENGVGTFYSDDTFKGKPIRVRFLWTRVMSNTPHWEQAFSADAGQTWETNWTMDFTKVP